MKKLPCASYGTYTLPNPWSCPVNPSVRCEGCNGDLTRTVEDHEVCPEFVHTGFCIHEECDDECRHLK